MTHIARAPLWLVTAALCTVLTIGAHELAHYAGAVAMGARDVRLHWADITFDNASLDAGGVAVTWMAGPLLTHAVILWVWLGRHSAVVPLALGVGACSRDLVLLPFTIKLLLGRDITTFTNDEVTVATALDISPLPLAALAVLLGAGGLILFMTRAARTHGKLCAATLFSGTIVGIAVWSTVGPVLLPGGKGIG